MARYSYIAKDSKGKTYKGASEARGPAELRERLKKIGFYALSVKREKAGFFLGSKKAALGDLVVFSRQFSTMIGAGLPLSRSLKALEQQTGKLSLKTAINKIRIDIEGGLSLSRALAKHPKIFSEFFISLIRAGETGGILKDVLIRLADHLEKQEDLRRSVRRAFAYPLIVGILAAVVVGFLVVFIVPVFKSVYSRLNLILPGPTLALIWVSGFVRSFWRQILLFIGIAAFFLKSTSGNPVFRKYLGRLKINLPFFGKLIQDIAVMRFIRVFGDMITSGVTIIESLKVADKSAGNEVVSGVVKVMIDNVYGGGLISEVLKGQDIFPAPVTQMIAAGEESGSLGFMLEKSAESLEKEVDDTIKRLVVKIEPLMTFLMALVVGFIAVSIYLPIFDVIKEISIGQ